MKDFLKQYCNIIAYSLMGLIFAFASFFFIVNLYHQSEISRTFDVKVSEDASMVTLKNNINAIKSNIEGFNVNNYHGSLTSFQAMAAEQKLRSCVNILDSETIQELNEKDTLTIVDVYYLREKFENEVLGKCVIGELMWFQNVEKNNVDNEFLKANQGLVELYIKGMQSETSYLKKDLLNNSSFYFNTSLVASTLHHNVKDGYYDVMTSYNKASSLVKYFSEWFNEETKGARS